MISENYATCLGTILLIMSDIKHVDESMYNLAIIMRRNLNNTITCTTKKHKIPIGANYRRSYILMNIITFYHIIEDGFKNTCY